MNNTNKVKKFVPDEFNVDDLLKGEFCNSFYILYIKNVQLTPDERSLLLNDIKESLAFCANQTLKRREVFNQAAKKAHDLEVYNSNKEIYEDELAESAFREEHDIYEDKGQDIQKGEIYEEDYANNSIDSGTPFILEEDFDLDDDGHYSHRIC